MRKSRLISGETCLKILRRQGVSLQVVVATISVRTGPVWAHEPFGTSLADAIRRNAQGTVAQIHPWIPLSKMGSLFLLKEAATLTFHSLSSRWLTGTPVTALPLPRLRQVFLRHTSTLHLLMPEQTTKTLPTAPRAPPIACQPSFLAIRFRQPERADAGAYLVWTSWFLLIFCVPGLAVSDARWDL